MEMKREVDRLRELGEFTVSGEKLS